MSNRERRPPGRGARPGIEDQDLAESTGKPAQVPGVPGGPNADAFDVSPEAEELRPKPGEGPLDPRFGPEDLLTDEDA
jgi:hypothetical protein